jgi:outer membrane protein assembly factor BamB
MKCGSLFFAFLFTLTPAVLAADEPARSVRFRESVAIEKNLTAQHQFELAQAHLAEKRWKEAVDLIRQVAASDPRSLVAVQHGRYLNVGLYAQLLLSSLPPEGLAVARKEIDDSARRILDDAVRSRDELALRTIVRNAFVSRAADDAMMTLGQWAWESGDLTQARGWWERLLPLRPPAPAGTAAALLRYPDTHFDPAAILARLVTCSIVEGDAERAAAEREAFRRMFPQAQGRLGERAGKLADRLDEIAVQAASWTFPARDTAVATFGVNSARNGVLPEEIDVGSPRWSTELALDLFGPVPGTRPARDRSALSLFPVTHGEILFVNTAYQILAWNVRTGKPAWPTEHNEGAVLYPPLAENAPVLAPPQLVGTPRYTMTIREGRLFARMGSPITAGPSEPPRESDSHIVCLDLEHGEGKLVWKVDSVSIDPQAAFEGSPLVADGRAFVAMRKGRPQMQTDVVAFDSESGRRLWERTVCAAVSTVGQNESLISHQLLTAGDDAVFLSTGAGAIAAVESESGTLRWITTYASEIENTASSTRETEPASPCLFSQNVVFAAPPDCDGMLAIDSRSGLVLWRQELPGRIEHLLGTKNGVLIASGKSLWGLDPRTGDVVWHVGFADPATFGFGRGILAGNVVYWPTREEVFVVAQATGALRRRIPLQTRYLEAGGNLLLAGDSLVIAQPQRITVFGPESGRPRREPNVLSLRLSVEQAVRGE